MAVVGTTVEGGGLAVEAGGDAAVKDGVTGGGSITLVAAAGTGKDAAGDTVVVDIGGKLNKYFTIAHSAYLLG